MESTKIKDVLIEPLNIELEEPFTIAIGTKYTIENVILTITLENGIEGYGEAAPLEPINGENQATVLAVLNSCKDFLIGKNASNYRSISKQVKNIFWPQITALCAIEMALLDAFTKTLNIPLYQFFGGMQNEIETDYTIDIVSSDEAKRNAIILAKKGYRILKIKVGKNPTEDIDRILAIKDGAPDCQITLDANQGFAPYEALRFLENLAENNIRPILFEQPVVKHDLPGMKFVKDNTSIPVAADETVFTSADAINVIRSGCADVINIKIMKSGIIGALDIAAIARSANIGLMIGCMLESVLSKSASVHIAAGLGGFSFIDLDPHSHPEKDPFTGGPQFNDPIYTLADDNPGIGVFKK
ncbi:dipeptide epimerase [bacterium]|nr:dipeptide epimerase [bacterium]